MDPFQSPLIKKFARRKWLGMTLVEVLIATAVFIVSFGGLLVAQQTARTRTEHALINFVTLHYSQGLLEAIQSYPYEDNTFDPNGLTPAATAFTAHPAALGAYLAGTNQSGVYANDGVTWISSLPEASLGFGCFRTSLPASPTPLNPFTSTWVTDNATLIGPEIGDAHAAANPAGGLYRITQNQRSLNVFATRQKDGSISGQERAFFFDDVDDFDGYREVRSILSGIDVTFEISVMPIYDRNANYNFSYVQEIVNMNWPIFLNATIPQLPFHPLMPISEAQIRAVVPALNVCLDPVGSTQAAGFGYYRRALFKKITIKATWTFPIGSNNTHTIVLDGGKINNNSTGVA